MKLLIFIHSLHSGGAERVTTNLANYWAQKGWDITVVTLASANQDFYQLHPAVKRIALDMAGNSDNFLIALRNNARRVRALRRILKDTRPNVALGMMSIANILLALAAIGLKNTVTVGSERNYPPRIPLGRLWEILRSHLYGNLHAMVALTSESAAWLRRHTRASNIPVIPNAVFWPLNELAPYLPPESQNNGRYTLLAVGRLASQKGFDLLIAAFQGLAADFPDWQLIILGEGPERHSLETQIRIAGLEGRILLPGRAGNVGQWYENADLYVMSSRFEGFPNTLAEAMAHGLPTVSFDCETGPRDIIRHNIDGLLVPAGSVVDLAAALRRLMANERQRSQLGHRGKEVLQRFSMQKTITMWENLFSELRDEH